MKLRYQREPRQIRGRRAIEVVSTKETKSEDQFNPRSFITGKDREFLRGLTQKGSLSFLELDVLNKSAWVSGLDERYLQELAQVPGLEQHLWSEVLRFRDMNLRPFNEQKRIQELSPDEVIQVLISYIDAVILLRIFPESEHTAGIKSGFRKEKPTFTKLLESPDIPSLKKAGIAFLLTQIEPKNQAEFLRHISVADIKRDLQETEVEMEDLAMCTALFPELRTEIQAAFERIQPNVEARLSTSLPQRFSGTQHFVNYLQESVMYIALTAENTYIHENGALGFKLKPELGYQPQPLPERPSV